MKWNEKLSNILRTVGVIPYMFIVFAPSLILTIFNIYFNLSIFETVAIALGLSYQYYQKLKWFVYLSSILLIMRPLIEQLFATTGNSINATEASYLKMMKYVGIGIIGVGGIAYIMAYLIGEINVNEYKQIANPSWFQSVFGFNMEIVGKRPINFYEAGIDIASMFASYFTETLAGFMLITSKDILFPSNTKHVTEPNKDIGGLMAEWNQKYGNLKSFGEITSEADLTKYKEKLGDLRQIKNRVKNIDNLKGKELEGELKKFDEIANRGVK